MNYKPIAIDFRFFKAFTFCICFLGLSIIVKAQNTESLPGKSDGKGSNPEASRQEKKNIDQDAANDLRFKAFIDSIARLNYVHTKGFKPDAAPNPFRKGAYRVMMQEFVGFNSFNSYQDGVKESHTSEFTLSPSLDYNIGKGFGVGLGFDIDMATTENENNTKEKTNSWQVSAALSYGVQLSGNFNLYGRFSAYTGGLKSTFETPTVTNTEEADQNGFRFSVGSPIPIGNQEIYFVPRITYMHDVIKYDDGKIKDNHYGLTADFIGFPSCEKKHVFTRYYQQGTFIIEDHTTFMYKFGSSTTDFTNPSFPDEETDLSELKLNVDAVYFIADYLGIGANTGIRTQTEKSDDNNFEINSTTFKFIPRVVGHVPVENLKHLFAEVWGGIGSQKVETKFGTISNEIKYSTSTFGGGIGYNIPITTNVFLTLQGNYQKLTQKNEDTDQKDEQKGFGLSGRVRFTF